MTETTTNLTCADCLRPLAPTDGAGLSRDDLMRILTSEGALADADAVRLVALYCFDCCARRADESRMADFYAAEAEEREWVRNTLAHCINCGKPLPPRTAAELYALVDFDYPAPLDKLDERRFCGRCSVALADARRQTGHE